jgi:hypothetical protein
LASPVREEISDRILAAASGPTRSTRSVQDSTHSSNSPRDIGEFNMFDVMKSPLWHICAWTPGPVQFPDQGLNLATPMLKTTQPVTVTVVLAQHLI